MLEVEDHHLSTSDASDTMNSGTFMTNCASSLRTFLLRLQVRRTLKGVFCVRPACCWSHKQNDQVIANASLFETEQKSIGEHRHQCLCVNIGTLTLMEMNCK